MKILASVDKAWIGLRREQEEWVSVSGAVLDGATIPLPPYLAPATLEGFEAVFILKSLVEFLTATPPKKNLFPFLSKH